MGKRRNKITAPPAQDAAPLPMVRDKEGGAGMINWKLILIVAVVSIAVYSNTLFMDFIWDDLVQIQENKHIKHIEYVPKLFTSGVWSGVRGMGTDRTMYYRPVFTLSLAIDYAFWKEKPFGYHLTNMLLHAGVSVLIFLIALKILQSGLPALFAGLVFAVHPVHADAVAWISARNELLAAIFMFSAFYLYLIYKEKRNVLYLFLSLLGYFLSLLSKETAITLPAFILVYELCLGSGPIKRRFLWPAVFGLVVVPYVVLRMTILGGLGIHNYSFPQRFFTAMGLIVEYVRLLVLPVNLKVHYDMPIQQSFLDKDVLVPFILVGSMCVGLVLSFRYSKKLFLGFAWIFLGLFPSSGLVRLIMPALMAERYLYIPSAGFAIVCGLLFLMARDRFRRSDAAALSGTYGVGLSIVAVLVIVTLFALSFIRNYVYKDQFTHSVTMTKEAPAYATGRVGLSSEYLKRGQTREALDEVMKVFGLNPSISNLGRAYVNLGIIYNAMGRYEDAMAEFKKALAINPDSAMTYYALGESLKGLGRIDEAIRAFKTALQKDPEHIEAHTALGNIYIETGRLEEAQREYNAELRENKRFKVAKIEAGGYVNRGVLYNQQGRYEEAIKELQEAVKLKPESHEAYYNLGVSYHGLGRMDEAVNALKSAVKIKPDLIDAYNYLGTIYIETARYDEALAAFKEELRLGSKFSSPQGAIAEAHFNIGYVYGKQRRFTEAEKELLSALKLNPRHVGAYNRLGVLYVEQKKFDEAVVQFRNALSISPDNKEVKENLRRASALVKR